MTKAEILVPLKIDLQLTTTAYDDYLGRLVDAAILYIQTEGIELTDTTADLMLVEMYAAYLFRHRRENMPMPRMLRWTLNNRLFSQKVNGGDDNAM